MLSESTRQYLSQISSLARPSATGEVSFIHVDSVSSKIAGLYEKLRQVIDYQEDHLLRKNTIERILKRRLLLSSDPAQVAGPLVSELIRGGYFPNDKIPETRIEEIRQVLAKYVFFMEYLPQLANGQKEKMENWLPSLAASEIEERLTPPRKEIALVRYLSQELEKRLSFDGLNLSQERQKEMIFVASQKVLLKSDFSLLSWWLLRLKFPEFAVSPSPEYLVSFLEKLPQIHEDIVGVILDPLVKRVCERAYLLTPVFLLLQDVAMESPDQALTLFENSESLEARLKLAFERKYRSLQRDNQRIGLRWVISILLSKMVLALLIEVPYDRSFGHFSPQALAINLFVPPFLMYLMVSSLKLPGESKKNTIAWEAMKIVAANQSNAVWKIRPKAEKQGLVGLVLRLVFLASSGLVFAATVWLLLKINFSPLSIVVFLAFFSLIAFSGIRIEANNRQFRGEEKETGFLAFLTEIFFLPFRKVGRWLSGQLQKYNLIILILNLFFEAPLQVFFEFVESWRDYLKRKREEME